MLSFGCRLVVLICFANAQHVLLNTDKGTMMGVIEKSREGRPFFAFYSIPYAEPPVGELRFENPVPPKSWRGVKDCTELPPACLSYEGENVIYGQEDCLYLNVYTPKLSADSPLPVMVFVYGGKFMYGNALPGRYGPHYFMDKDIILVTFHYRLGVLGFLSLEDADLPGNYGFKDFAAVLKWVRENIHSFSGDPNKVTIAGGSSGGCTTSYALISPLMDGLFSRCISQSGFPVIGILPRGVARQRARLVANNVGCTGDSNDVVSCLKQIPANTLVQENHAFNALQTAFPFGAVIEDESPPGAFLVDTAEVLLPRNTSIPWIIGINSDEGGMSAIFKYFGHEKNIHELAANYDKHIPALFGFTPQSTKPDKLKEVADRIRKRFFGDTNIEKNPIAYSKMISLLYLLPLRKSLSLYRGPKYVYHYDHRNEESFSKMYGDPPSDLDFGVIHGDELISFFNWSDVITPVTKGIDLVVSKQMLELWTNFALFGDPNGMGPKVWTSCKSSRIEHLHVNQGKLMMRNELRREEFDFLDELSALISKDDED